MNSIHKNIILKEGTVLKDKQSHQVLVGGAQDSFTTDIDDKERLLRLSRREFLKGLAYAGPIFPGNTGDNLSTLLRQSRQQFATKSHVNSTFQ